MKNAPSTLNTKMSAILFYFNVIRKRKPKIERIKLEKV